MNVKTLLLLGHGPCVHSPGIIISVQTESQQVKLDQPQESETGVKFVAGRPLCVPRQPAVPSKANNSNKLVSARGIKTAQSWVNLGRESLKISIIHDMFLICSTTISLMTQSISFYNCSRNK